MCPLTSSTHIIVHSVLWSLFKEGYHTCSLLIIPMSFIKKTVFFLSVSSSFRPKCAYIAWKTPYLKRLKHLVSNAYINNNHSKYLELNLFFQSRFIVLSPFGKFSHFSFGKKGIQVLTDSIIMSYC